MRYVTLAIFVLPCRVAAGYATPAVRPTKRNPKCICFPSVATRCMEGNENQNTYRVRGFRTLQECRNEIGGKRSAMSQDTTKAVVLRSTTLSPAPSPKQAGNTRTTCRGIVDRTSASPAAHKRMAGKFLIDVFGGDGFLTEATHL